MATGFPTKANWVSGDILTASAMDDLAGTVNLMSNASATSGSVLLSNAAGSSFVYQSAYNGNQIINGGFDIWQRGTSFTAGSVYGADRWYLNAVTGTTTVSRDTDVPTGLAGQYSIKQLTAAGSSFAQWSTPLETATVIPLQGQTMVLSWYMKANATWSNNFSAVLFYSNSTDARASQTTSVTFTAVSTPTPTTSWARYYGTFTMPSDAQGLLVQFNPTASQASGASLNVAGVQLEIGSVPTKFKRAGGNIQGELAACQRYYWRLTAAAANYYLGGRGNASSTTNINMFFSPPVTMRVTPTGVEGSQVSITNEVNTYPSTAVALTLGNSNDLGVSITITGPTVALQSFTAVSGSSSAGYIGFTAEL